MKYLMTLIVTAVCMFGSLQASAEQKIGVANLDLAIENTSFAKTKLQSLDNNSEYKALKAKYKALEKELTDLINEGNTKGVTWSDERKIEQRNKIEYVSSDLKLARTKLANMRNEVFEEIGQTYTREKMVEAINKVMEAKQLSVIIKASAVLGIDDALNVTDDLTEQLNKLK